MSSVQTALGFPLEQPPSCSSSSTRTLIRNLLSLNLVLGSFYIPKLFNDAKPLGDDAHFVCQEMKTFGVADGVGCWTALRGIDAGEYARQLMSNALAAVKKQPFGGVDLHKVLNQAYSDTTAQGSSTACILTLKGETLSAINVGDSSFRIVRNLRCVYQSPVQQRRFNFPYQLGNSDGCDDPSLAQLLEGIPVEEGDVVILGTDGVFDNLFDYDIELEVQLGLREGLKPKEMARRIAELALYNSYDDYNPSPYGMAAKRAGFTHYGGKVDDISVIVAYVVW